MGIKGNIPSFKDQIVFGNSSRINSNLKKIDYSSSKNYNARKYSYGNGSTPHNCTSEELNIRADYYKPKDNNLNIREEFNKKNDNFYIAPIEPDEEHWYDGIVDYGGCLVDSIESYEATKFNLEISMLEGIATTADKVMKYDSVVMSLGATLFTSAYDEMNGTNITEKMWDKTKAYVISDDVKTSFDDIYKYTKFGEWIKENSYAFDNVREYGAEGAQLVLNELVERAAGKEVAMALNGITNFTDGAADAWRNGASTEDGLKVGLFKGFKGAAEEYVDSKIDSFDKFGSEGANIATKFGLNTANGAADSFTDTAIKAMYAKTYIDPETGEEKEFTEDDDYFDRLKKLTNASDIAIDGLINGGINLAFDGFGYAVDKRNAKKAANTIGDGLDNSVRRTDIDTNSQTRVELDSTSRRTDVDTTLNRRIGVNDESTSLNFSVDNSYDNPFHRTFDPDATAPGLGSTVVLDGSNGRKYSNIDTQSSIKYYNPDATDPDLGRTLGYDLDATDPDLGRTLGYDPDVTDPNLGNTLGIDTTSGRIKSNVDTQTPIGKNVDRTDTELERKIDTNKQSGVDLDTGDTADLSGILGYISDEEADEIIGNLITNVTSQSKLSTDDIDFQTRLQNAPYKKYGPDGQLFVSETPEGMALISDSFNNAMSNKSLSRQSFYQNIKNNNMVITDIRDTCPGSKAYGPSSSGVSPIVIDHNSTSSDTIFFHEPRHYDDMLGGNKIIPQFNDVVDQASKLPDIDARRDKFIKCYREFEKSVKLQLDNNYNNDIAKIRKELVSKNINPNSFRTILDSNGNTRQVSNLDYFYHEYRELIFDRKLSNSGYYQISDFFDSIYDGEILDKHKLFGHGSNYWKNIDKGVELSATFSELYCTGNTYMLDSFFPPEIRLKLTDILESDLEIKVKNEQILDIIGGDFSYIENYLKTGSYDSFPPEMRQQISKFTDLDIKKLITTGTIGEDYFNYCRRKTEQIYGVGKFEELMVEYAENGNSDIFNYDENIKNFVSLLDKDGIILSLNGYRK